MSMDIDNSLFGKKIEFNTVLKRGYDQKFSNHGGGSMGSGRSWTQRKIPKTNGIIIGIRTLQNGAVHWEVDGPTYFVPHEYVRCFLVAVDMRKNPVYVSLLSWKIK